MIDALADYIATLPHRQAITVALCMAVGMVLVNAYAARIPLARNGGWRLLVLLAYWVIVSMALIVIVWIIDMILVLGIWT